MFKHFASVSSFKDRFCLYHLQDQFLDLMLFLILTDDDSEQHMCAGKWHRHLFSNELLCWTGCRAFTLLSTSADWGRADCLQITQEKFEAVRMERKSQKGGLCWSWRRSLHQYEQRTDSGTNGGMARGTYTSIWKPDKTSCKTEQVNFNYSFIHGNTKGKRVIMSLHLSLHVFICLSLPKYPINHWTAFIETLRQLSLSTPLQIINLVNSI